MKKRQKLNFFLSLLCCCTAATNYAQQDFHNKAKLNDVPVAGFYQVNLLPQVSALLQPNMNDIRIVDSSGKQVPYILKGDLPSFNESKFTELPIRSVKKEADAQTHIIIENTLQQPLDELLLIIKNTDADRIVTLSGSDDAQKWFVIKEHIYLNSYFSTDADKFVQTLSFPKSSYHFFRITINGKDVLPVNIVKAGIYQQSLQTGKYLPITTPALSQKDSTDKHSYIAVQFNEHYFIDRLILQIQGPKFYKRNLEVYSTDNNSKKLLGNFTISSDKEAVLPLSVKSGKLLLIINNDDNPALHVDTANAFQLNKYLLAYLEKSNAYQLLFNDSAATAPVYDLEAFKDSIAGNATTLQYSSIEKNTLPQIKLPTERTDNKLLIWLAIAAAVFALLFLSYRLVGEIKRSA